MQQSKEETSTSSSQSNEEEEKEEQEEITPLSAGLATARISSTSKQEGESDDNNNHGETLNNGNNNNNGNNEELTLTNDNNYDDDDDGRLLRYNGEGCVVQNDKVTKVIVEDGVTSLSKKCFQKCKLLEHVELPSSLTSIPNYCFFNCKSLKEIVINNGGLTTIGWSAFSGCSSLEQITIPDSVTEIKLQAFQQCTSLKEIIIPPSVKSIEYETFYDCIMLNNIALPQNLQSIIIRAFCNCWKLKKVNLSNNIKSIHPSAFDGCINLPIDSMEWPSAMKENTQNEIVEKIKKNPWLPANIKSLRENIILKQGPGGAYNFGGKTQRGWGPEYWAISRQQLIEFKAHPLYRHLTMREFVSQILEVITEGLGIGYALLKNQGMPLIAKIMISHAWDEPLHEFVDNILASGEDGPFWICSTGIYQNNDAAKGVTISEQIGPSPEHGPFATVLQVVDRMLAVITTQCNIYTRLWCVYELFIASKFNVPVTLRPFIGDEYLRSGQLEEDVCIANIGERINSEAARCGNPNSPPNADEIAIRNTIEASEKKFQSVDEAVELIRLIYLLHYPTDKIKIYVTSARDKLKDAIEIVLSRLPLLCDRMKTYDEFVKEQLSIHQGYSIMDRPENVDEVNRSDLSKSNYLVNYHCIVSDSSPDEKIDVFDAWIKYMIGIVQAIVNVN